jgi:hypothetical protein
LTNKRERIGSKTAPTESVVNKIYYLKHFDLIDEEDEIEDNDYIKSYNYYIYYHSIKPKDPRLPKPLYKPTPNLEFIKSGMSIEENEFSNSSERDSAKGISTFNCRLLFEYEYKY